MEGGRRTKQQEKKAENFLLLYILKQYIGENKNTYFLLSATGWFPFLMETCAKEIWYELIKIFRLYYREYFFYFHFITLLNSTEQQWMKSF